MKRRLPNSIASMLFHVIYGHTWYIGYDSIFKGYFHVTIPELNSGTPALQALDEHDCSIIAILACHMGLFSTCSWARSPVKRRHFSYSTILWKRIRLLRILKYFSGEYKNFRTVLTVKCQIRPNLYWHHWPIPLVRYRKFLNDFEVHYRLRTKDSIRRNW